MNSAARWLFLLAGCLVSLGCGSGATGGGPICTEGEESSPGQVDDPCPQTGTGCADVGGSAYAVCGADGVWAAECKCRTAAAICGNGVREGSEQCDGADLGGGSCSMANGSGTLLCDAATCTYDFSMCTSSGVGGNGGS